jgi:predicted DCC family thiol-disulfide oxidoreductase YuxK
MERRTDGAGALEVWIDGDCGLCQRSRSWCELRDNGDRVRFKDFRSTADSELPVARGDLEASMWVRDPSGRLFDGFAAWRMIMNELPGWRWLARLASTPPLMWLGPPLYRVIAKNRHRLPTD